MRKLGLSTAVISLIAASNAFALTASLSQNGTGLTVINAAGGGTFDLSIDLSRSSVENTYGSMQMNFTASTTGASIVGVVGSSFESGTGTRYNELEWDASTSTINGNATNPNSFSGPMPAGVARGTMSTLASNAGFGQPDSGSATVSHFGHLVVTISPGAIFPLTITPTQVEGGELESGDFNAVPGTGQGVTFVPEPTTALLLLGALPFVRRRRLA